MYARWLTPEGWEVTRKAFFGRLPPPLKWIIPNMARRSVRAQFMGHGMGRHEPEAIWRMAMADVDAIAAQLGGQDYLMGDRPCSVDAVAYGFLANILWTPPDCPLRRHARAIPALEAYCQRMKARYWGD